MGLHRKKQSDLINIVLRGKSEEQGEMYHPIQFYLVKYGYVQQCPLEYLETVHNT